MMKNPLSSPSELFRNTCFMQCAHHPDTARGGCLTAKMTYNNPVVWTSNQLTQMYKTCWLRKQQWWFVCDSKQSGYYFLYALIWYQSSALCMVPFDQKTCVQQITNGKGKRKAVKNDAKICTYMYHLRLQFLPPDITNEKPLTVEAESKISIMLIRNSL